MRPALLIWGPRDGRDPWTCELEDDLRRLGWEVHRTPRRRDDKERERQEILELARDVRARAFLTTHIAWSGGPSVRTLNGYREAGLLTVTLCHDEPYRWDGYDDRAALQAPGYDLWFTNWDDPAHLARHTARRVVYSPCAARAAFRPRPAVARDVPVGFVGVYYPARDPYLRAVADLGLTAWMIPRTAPPFHPWPPPPGIAACLAARLVYMHAEEVAHICHRSAISLDTAEQPDGRVRSPKNRLFESLCAGSFTLAGRCRQTEELFEDGEHLVLYDGADDLRAKAMYYLLHPEERERIAREGARHARCRHTWLHRALQVSREIGQDLERRDRFRLDGVGVVIHAHGQPELLSRALASAYGVPVAVVSTGKDELPAEHDCRIRARGASKARAYNLGALALPEDVRWIQFLDEDEFLRVGWKQALAAALGHGGPVTSRVASSRASKSQGTSPRLDRTLCLPRDLFLQAGGFEEHPTLGPERDMLRRLRLQGHDELELDALLCGRGSFASGEGLTFAAL